MPISRRWSVEAADSPKGAKGLICLPYFSGERTPIHDPHAKGAFFGMDLTHTRADLFRAVWRGSRWAPPMCFETYAEVGASPDRCWRWAAGTKNALWLQATSDLAGVARSMCEKTIGASYGDAFLAALAVGLVPSRGHRAVEPGAGRWSRNGGRLRHGSTRCGSGFTPDP
jgi:xylulokinase